jgi:hypothetical protein
MRIHNLQCNEEGMIDMPEDNIQQGTTAHTYIVQLALLKAS